MTTLDIQLKATADVRRFVNLSNRYAFSIGLRQGRASIDAKSLLGILSLDLTLPITVEIFDGHCQEYVDALEEFAC